MCTLMVEKAKNRKQFSLYCSRNSFKFINEQNDWRCLWWELGKTNFQIKSIFYLGPHKLTICRHFCKQAPSKRFIKSCFRKPVQPCKINQNRQIPLSTELGRQQSNIGRLARLARGKDRKKAATLNQYLTFGDQRLTHDGVVFVQITRAGCVKFAHGIDYITDYANKRTIVLLLVHCPDPLTKRCCNARRNVFHSQRSESVGENPCNASGSNFLLDGVHSP